MPKDAKGHGSNPRGGPAAHQEGVNKVGKAAPPVSKLALDTIRNNPGGFSVRPNGAQPTAGHMVSVPGRTQYVNASDLAGPGGQKIINDFVQKNSDLYANNPAMHIGGWTNEGKVSLDPSENIADRNKAYSEGVARDFDLGREEPERNSDRRDGQVTSGCILTSAVLGCYKSLAHSISFQYFRGARHGSKNR